MHRLALALALLALVACKDDKKTTAAVAASDAAAAAAPDGGTQHKPKKPMLPPAGPPGPATADDCKVTGEYATATLRVAAEASKVAADKLDATAKELTAAFIERCQEDAWPAYFLDCMGKAPSELTTYLRCFDRLPAAAFATWEDRLYAILGKAGGIVPERPAATTGEGVRFEELCAEFVAEMARLDDCAGAGMYVPELEQVWNQGRHNAVGGLIPTPAQAPLKKLCDERALRARDVASQMCQKP